MSTEESGPPAALLRALVEGPSAVAGVEWHDTVDSTNRVAAEAAARGVPEIHVVGSSLQTAGRGRLGRPWSAPAGTSLTFSMALRPAARSDALTLLPLLAGLALADAVAPHVPESAVALKWPNDLLVDERKAAGILVEGPHDGSLVVGVGLNIDWRGVQRPEELSGATSLAEAAGAAIDRWRVLAGFLGLFANRYDTWKELPAAFLDGYRARCATLGRAVRVERVAAPPVQGVAVEIAPDGALLVDTGQADAVVVGSGDVHHLRPA